MELGCVSSLNSTIRFSVQLEQCKSTIERMRREIIQKHSIISDLAAQAAEGPGNQDIAAPLIEEDCDVQQYKSQVQSSLEEVTAERDALEARASGQASPALSEGQQGSSATCGCDARICCHQECRSKERPSAA